MIVAKKNALYPWMAWPETQKLMQVIGGFDDVPQSLFVGGCVRNSLLGLPVSDLDIATIHTPDVIIKCLESKGIRAIPTGIDHGTVTAIVEGKSFEITTLRHDVETDGRRAVVSYTTDWAQDAQRRDFTINTLLADMNGNIYDPTGEGIADLNARRVRFVGDPEQRVREDYLRILRFFRFYAAYGQGSPDKAALEACAKYADKITVLSKERITDELFKILSLRNAPDILLLMRQCGILKEFLGGFNSEVMDCFVNFQHHLGLIDPLFVCLMACDLNVDRMISTLSLSNDQKKSISDVFLAKDYLSNLDEKTIKRSVYWHGNKATTQAYLMQCAERNLPAQIECVDVARYWHAPVFPVTGQGLLERGYREGAELGAELKRLEREWVLKNIV